MKTGWKTTALRLALAMTFCLCVSTVCRSEVTTCPIPKGESVYDGFELQVDGQSVPVYSCRVSAVPLNQWWPGYQRPIDQTELAGFAYWDMIGSVEVQVTVKRPIDNVVVRPLSLGIKPEIDGDKIRFTLDCTAPVVVEVNGYHNALHLFPNPVQKDVPKAESEVCCPQCNYCSPKMNSIPESGSPRLIVFAPGVHDVGTLMLQSNDSVYIAGGAVVYGSLVADNVDNIRVWGRGVLDGGHIQRADRWARGGFGCIHFRNSTNISVDGIVLRDPNSWGITLRGCREASLSNLKLVGFWRYNADGLDVWSCEDVSVDKCFVRSFDDVFIVRDSGRNIRFSDCVLWCDWGQSLGLAGSPIENVTFENIDLIRLAHCAMTIRTRNKHAIRNVKFDTINVELDDWIARPKMQESKEEQYVTNPEDDYCPRLISMQRRTDSPGAVDNMLFENISVHGKATASSSFSGVDDEYGVRNVRIKNLRFNGQPVKNAEEANLTIGPYVTGLQID